MRLFLPSVIVAVYTILSLVIPLRTGLLIKTAISLGIIAASLKYVFYQIVGGGFFRPELPAPVMLAAEALYASLLILFMLALTKDLIGLVFRVFRLFGATWTMPFTPGIRCGALVLLALASGVWGTWQAVKVPDVHTVDIALPNLPAELEGFTLVQLSDLHIGPVQKQDWLRQVVNKVNALSPDAVAITGDMIDGLPRRLRDDVAPLADLKARYGVFGVTGNHEYYYDARGWIAAFQSLGITMLNNEYRVLPGGLVLGGVPDSTTARFGGGRTDVGSVFAHAPSGPRILLAHKPNDPGLPAPGVDLQLSGHTHGGLMFFLAPLIGMYNGGYVNGLYETPYGGLLYVSPGTGLWNGLSCRLGVASEITRIRLHKKASSHN